MTTAYSKSVEFSLQNVNSNTDYDKYLVDLHDYLTTKGFKKHKQGLLGLFGEDFSYWKQYDNKYQIGLLIYDWRKYEQHTAEKKIGIMFECLPLRIEGRCNLSVSRNIELHEFEQMAASFYNAMRKYL